MADAALKAHAFERAFFNAKSALLIFAGINYRSSDIRGERFTGSCADKIREAEKIACVALEHMNEGDVAGIQNEWEKIERAYNRVGGAVHCRANLAVTWGLAKRFQKWRMRRRLNIGMKNSNLFGKWATLDD